MHRKVLLLDDMPDRVDRCRQALQEIEGVTYKLIHAASGGEGLALIESEGPDCTLINWWLPGNGAVAALHRIRTRHAHTPVIMMADGDAPSWRLEEMQAAGDCQIFKAQITPAALHAAIEEAIHQGKILRTSARIAPRSHTVLIIDDNPDDRELCARAMARADERYRIIEATGSEAGLALVEQERPDCVLLDYSLPGQSGFGVLRRIHAIDAYLPVIILTGQGDEALAVQAMKSGAQNYLLKSTLHPATLQRAVVSAIEHASLEREIAEQRQQIYEQRLALAETSRLTSAVLDSAPCLICVTDATGKVLVFNKELERAVGYSAHEVVGKHTPLLWSPQAPILKRAEAAARRNAGVAAGEIPVDGPGADKSEAREMTFVHKDGHEVPVSLWIRDLYNSDSQIVGFLGLGEDITERKAHLDALKTSEETFRSAMEYAPCGMALIDMDGRFLKVNKALCGIAGYEDQRLRDTTLQALTHPDDVHIDADLHWQLLAGDIQSYTTERRILDKAGSPVDVQIHLSLVRSANGQPHYFVAQIQDIRQRKEIDRLKSEFVAVFSHELRTPLTSIRGSLGLLSAETFQESPAKADYLVNIALRNCERLILLINDILDISRLESRHMRFDMRPTMLNAMVRDAVEANRGYAETCNVTLRTTLPAQDVLVNVDSVRFMQVLSNFISNAAKFSPRGEEVNITMAQRDERVRVSVSDRGPGIPPSFVNRLFQKFSQADTAPTRRAGGSGLGLFISKQLAERMDGIVGVETVEGRGSTFWIELPVRREGRSALMVATRR
jgi:PAS domain S-box-containing protein